MKLIVLVVLCLVWLTESLQDSLKGTHVVLDNIEFVYQLPLQKPNGVVFFAHGCSHHARDWWPKGETCQNCVGLPIEMSITHGTLSRGYVALAITAANQEHHCWTEEDLGRVNTVFKHLYSNILNDTSYSLPLFAIGGSSGGSFVGLLAQHQNVAPAPIAVSIQISYTRIIANNPKAHFFFLPMLKDSFTLTKIEKSVTRIKHHAIYSTREKAINKNFFQVYGFGIFTVEESEKIYQALINANIIDSKSNLLIEDPRRSNWRNAILKDCKEILDKDSLVADASPLSELLNFAFAMHEITNDYLNEVFEFFKDTASLKINGIRTRSRSVQEGKSKKRGIDHLI